MCRRTLGTVCSLTLSLAVLVALGVGILYARLSMGPLQLPGVASQLASYISSESDTYDLSLSNVELSLGDNGTPAGIQFSGVEARDPDGTLLMYAPKVIAGLRLSDLLLGKYRPTRIALVRPDIRLQRTGDGRTRIGLAPETQVEPVGAADDPDEEAAAQYDAIARIMDGFAGDTEPVSQLEHLQSIAIIGIDLVYVDDVLQQTWHTQNANVRIWRTDAGAEARLTATIGKGDVARIPLQITASRPKGTGRTDLEMRFEGMTPAAVSSEMPIMDPGPLLDGEVSGYASASLLRDGTFENVSGVLRAENGTLNPIDGPSEPFDRIEVNFRYLTGTERIALDLMSVASPSLNAEFAGFVDVSTQSDRDATILETQLDVRRIRLDMLDVFPDVLNFDGGQITGRFTLSDDIDVNVANSFLTYGDLILAVDGTLRSQEGSWVTDIRATGQNVSVDAVKQHWPLAAAVNARTWIDANIQSGHVDQLVTHLRIAEGEPQLSLDFAYSDLSAQYISGMTPIRNAKGRGHLTFHDFYLFLDTGRVEPLAGEAIALDGSSLVFRDLWGAVTPTEVDLSGSGDLTAILTLIDQEPLALVGKLDLRPDEITGRAEVDARFTFPLLNDLLIDQIFVDVAADIESVAMPFTIAGRKLDITSDAIRLDGSIDRMLIAGDVKVDGTPLSLGWTENYGSGPNNRAIRASGLITPDLLAAFGTEIPGFSEGSVQAQVAVAQAGAKTGIDLEADLREAAVSVDGIGWSKQPGQGGELKIKGTLDDQISIDRVEFASNGLALSGKIDLAADGELRGADFEYLRLDEDLDIALQVDAAGSGLSVTATGRRVNLSRLLEVESGASGDAVTTDIAARFEVDQLLISDAHSLASASGTYRQTQTDTSADVSGSLAPGATIDAAYSKSGTAPGTLSVTSVHSGEILEYLGIYEGAKGGDLNVNASVDPDPDTTLKGILKIRGLTVSEGEGLREILRTGRFADEQVEQASSAVVFRSIRVPFDVSGSSIRLGESFAKSPSLAITAQGEIDQESDEVYLVGVISPAYGLSSAIDEVPILGQVLTGGEGEGIFGITFAVQGSIEDPQISVNPLSLLTPGFLRGIFSGKSTPSQRVIMPKER